jgi:hypothetical protein
MSKLSTSITDCLFRVSSPNGKPGDLAKAVSGLLDAERRLGDLSLGLEAFRETARSLGLLDEARNGDGAYEAWSKLSCFFLGPIRSRAETLDLNSTELVDTPRAFEALGSRWSRTAPELEAFLREEEVLERFVAGSPAHGHFKLRTRFILLDRRAERIKVSLDLLRRDLLCAAREGVERISGTG